MRVLVLLMLCVGLAARPTHAQSLDSLDPSGQVVVYWHEWDGPQLDAMREVVRAFNQTNPHAITVQLVGKSSSGRLLGALADPDPADALPNVVGGVFPSNADNLLRDGLTLGLDPYLAHPQWGIAPADRAAIDEGTVSAFRALGQQGAWPLGLSLNVLAVNRALLAQAGITAQPDTLEALVQAACAAASQTTPRGQAIRGFPLTLTLGDFETLVAAQQGAPLYDVASGQFGFASEGSKQVLRALAELTARDCAYDAGGQYDDSRDFAYGLTPFAFTSTAGLPFIEDDILDSASGLTDWTFMPAPGAHPTVTVYVRGVALTPHGTPAQQLAAWLFIRHLTTPEAQATWAAGLSYQPVNAQAYALLPPDLLTANPPYAAALALLRDDAITKLLAGDVVGYGDVESEVFEPMLESALEGVNLDLLTAEADRAAAEVVQRALARGD